jgi:hypothetical protein
MIFSYNNIDFNFEINSGHRITLHHFVLLVEDVVHLGCSSQGVYFLRAEDASREGEVAGIPWLFIVLGDIGRRFVTLARIDESCSLASQEPYSLSRH